jgi:hypothetical protein
MRNTLNDEKLKTVFTVDKKKLIMELNGLNQTQILMLIQLFDKYGKLT